jgi:hypothetical protein
MVTGPGMDLNHRHEVWYDLTATDVHERVRQNLSSSHTILAPAERRVSFGGGWMPLMTVTLSGPAHSCSDHCLAASVSSLAIKQFALVDHPQLVDFPLQDSRVRVEFQRP